MTGAEKRSLLARLLGRLAHEIRNPLSSLDIHVQLLEEDLAQLAPETRERCTERLEIIQGELRRLENLVKQFLRLAGPSELDLQPVDIARVLGHVCELLRPEAAARKIDISLELANATPTLMADPDQLTQALLNLIINAVQAVDEGGRIAVSTRLIDGGVFGIEVQDSGPGIPAASQETIFEPYFTTKPEGTGLGLWIAQQIALAHGGALHVWNAPAGGAVFSLRLPITDQTHHG